MKRHALLSLLALGLANLAVQAAEPIAYRRCAWALFLSCAGGLVGVYKDRPIRCNVES
ncbi:MAG: hypothetical protein ACK4TK_08485 [Thiobacillaceae bacterium]